MPSAMRVVIAVVVTFGIIAALPHSASAASKRHHHSTGATNKPSEQYLRSAAPPADKAQK
jgi:hypothetical protein